jgi:hypothetical protein
VPARTARQPLRSAPRVEPPVSFPVSTTGLYPHDEGPA